MNKTSLSNTFDNLCKKGLLKNKILKDDFSFLSKITNNNELKEIQDIDIKTTYDVNERHNIDTNVNNEIKVELV